MAARNLFRRRPQLRESVRSMIGPERTRPIERPDYHPNPYGEIVKKDFHAKSVRASIPGIELIPPKMSSKAGIGQRVLADRMYFLGGNVSSVESAIGNYYRILQRGTVWRPGNKAFQGVTRDVERARHAHSKYFGWIPGVNYIKSLGQELFTGRFWFGTKSGMQKINSVERAAFLNEIEKLKEEREVYAEEFLRLSEELRKGKAHPEKIDRFAEQHYHSMYLDVERSKKKEEKPSVNVQNIYSLEALREAQEEERRRRKVA